VAQPLPGEGGRYDTTLTPGASHTYFVRYRGGRLATVTLAAGERSGLELKVRDSTDREIPCRGERDSANGFMTCAWVPENTGSFKIRVWNGTDAYVGYAIFTN
jgi:hypothetical protein